MKKNVGSKNNNNLIHPHNSSKKQINKGTMPSNLASLNPIKVSNSSNSSKTSSTIYDDNFISLINQLSKIINALYKSNNFNFTKMKNILVNNNKILENNNLKTKNEKENNLSNISNFFNQIETSFNDFYSNAKILFQKMKIYETNLSNSNSNANNKPRYNPFKSVDNSNSNNKYNDINSMGNDFENNSNQRINKNIQNNLYNSTNEYSLVKINNQSKKNKITNRSSSSMINTTYNYSVDKNNYKSFNKQVKPSKNNNKTILNSNPNNNLSILSSKKSDNNYNDLDIEKNLNLILEENKELKNKNIILEKKNKNLSNLINSNKNSSSCNIRGNKPTRIIMDHSLVLNDLSMDKSFQGSNNNNSISATHRNKNDLNKSFCTMKNNYLLSLKLNNNNLNNKKNDITKNKNKPIRIKTIKENTKQIKDKIIQNQNNGNNFFETRNNVSKTNTQGTFLAGGMYSTMEDDYKKNNNSTGEVNLNKNKSLKHLKTSNNFILKRENSINNEQNNFRVNSIDKMTFTELSPYNDNNDNTKDDQLNYDKITVIQSKNKKLSSPFNNQLEMLQRQIFGEDYVENPENSGNLNKLKSSMNELSMENQKLMDEISKLKCNKDEELYKKISRFEGQIILLTRKNNELSQKLNESIEGKKKLLNVIKGNEKKINEYNEMAQKNIELGKIIKNYEKRYNNDNVKIVDLTKANKILESKTKDLTKKLKNSNIKINELVALVKSIDANSETNTTIKTLESRISELNGINKRHETEKKSL